VRSSASRFLSVLCDSSRAECLFCLLIRVHLRPSAANLCSLQRVEHFPSQQQKHIVECVIFRNNADNSSPRSPAPRPTIRSGGGQFPVSQYGDARPPNSASRTCTAPTSRSPISKVKSYSWISGPLRAGLRCHPARGAVQQHGRRAESGGSAPSGAARRTESCADGGRTCHRPLPAIRLPLDAD
jgi:hypothetical protein